MRNKPICGAYARSTDAPCRAKSLSNGRCRNHGGLSTGPKTPEGKSRIAQATKHRMASGQLKLAKEGFQRWLNDGGRERLSRLAIRRNQLKRMRALY
jgi:hypothetical protein